MTERSSEASAKLHRHGRSGHDGRGTVHHFEDIIAKADATPFTADTLSDEVAFWMYTSGSTGDPKGVKHVHSNLMATAKLFGQGILGIHENDVVHSASKLFFAYGLGNAMSFPLSVGATAALWPHRPSPEGVFETMRRHRPTIFYGVPSLYTALLSHHEICKGAGSDRLRICVSAGEALPAHIGERWRDTVGVDVLDGLGSTEMLNTFLSNRPTDIRYGSTGKPVPGYDARIVDENGRDLGTDEIGELIVRGPSAGEGYWNQREKSRRTFAGEWTHTGDKYRRDAEGYYYYCGRTDDMFKVSGMWVSPFDVEAALVSHEAVLEAAVIGKEDADGLIKPKAFIVLKNGFKADDLLLETLKVHVKDKAGPWKFPRWIELRSNLPRTATGKLQRFKLREEDAAAASSSLGVGMAGLARLHRDEFRPSAERHGLGCQWKSGSRFQKPRKLGVSKGSLSHSIREIEERLGVRLLNRTTRSVAPTEAGERMLARLRPLLDDLEATVDEVNEFRDRPAAISRLTMPRPVASFVIAPLLARFVAQYPEIIVDISVSPALTDIVAGRYDAGFRVGDRIGRDMIAVRVTDALRFVVAASPDVPGAASGAGKAPGPSRAQLHLLALSERRVPAVAVRHRRQNSGARGRRFADRQRFRSPRPGRGGWRRRRLHFGGIRCADDCQRAARPLAETWMAPPPRGSFCTIQAGGRTWHRCVRSLSSCARTARQMRERQMRMS